MGFAPTAAVAPAATCSSRTSISRQLTPCRAICGNGSLRPPPRGSPPPAESFKPLAGQWDAVEIAARFSAADLGDADLRGGRLTVWAAGVSWHPLEPLTFTLQHQHADVTAAAAPWRLDAVAVRNPIRC